MTGLNGVHALLAFLTQQAQLSKPSHGLKADVKQLESLLQESRLLNERLLKIEKLLSMSQAHDNNSTSDRNNNPSSVEGTWPAASLVRDVINSQERQQAFGYQQSERASALDAELYSYRETVDDHKKPNLDTQQLVIQRYIPSEFEQTFSNPGINFGAQRDASDYFTCKENETPADSGRLLLMSIGFSLLLFALFALVG
jgi:hypothetical protein